MSVIADTENIHNFRVVRGKMLFHRLTKTLNRRSSSALVLLLLLAVLGNILAINLFMGFYYLFGSIAVLVIFRLFGVAWSTLAAVCAAVVTIRLFGHPYAFIWLVPEPFCLALIFSRTKIRNLVIADTLYWPCIAAPLVFIISGSLLHLNLTESIASILMFWVVGITNSLIASLILENLPFARWLLLEETRSPVPLHHLLFNLLMALILLPALTIMVTGSRAAVARFSEKINLGLNSMANTVSYELQMQLTRYSAELTDLVESAERVNSFEPQGYFASAALSSSRELPELISIVAFDENLKVLFPSSEAGKPSQDEALRTFRRNLLNADRPQFSDSLLLQDGKFYTYLIGTRFIQSDTSIAGLTMGINPAALNSILKRLLIASEYTLVLVDSKQQVIATNKEDVAIGSRFDAAISPEAFPFLESGSRETLLSRKQMLRWQRLREGVFTSSRLVSDTVPWTIRVETPAAPYHEQLMGEHIRNLAGLLALCLLSLALSLYVANRLTAPLRTLSRMTTDLSERLENDEGIIWPTSTISELDLLLRNFQAMAGALSEKFMELSRAKSTLEERVNERTRELKEANAFLSMEIQERIQAEDDRDRYLNALLDQLEFQTILLEAIPNPIFFKNREGIYLGCNSAFLRLIDLQKEDVVGKTVFDIFPSDLAAVYNQADQSLFSRGGVQQYETEIGSSHNMRSVIFYKATYSGKNAAIEGLVGVILDISERKQAETQRDQLMLELSHKNKELESIVYAASHDLRSPLINIQGFSRKLEKSCRELEKLVAALVPEAVLPDAVREIFTQTLPKSLGFIHSSTDKMDTLLSGLLRLSRLGRATMAIEPIDMNRLIEEVVSNLGFQIQSTGAEISIEILPPCKGDSAQINQVFSNLLDNAIKYRQRDRLPQISISGSIDGEQIVYLVRDNGIGIASEHVEKIWDIFHRLNPSDQPGEGLGLTIVRRIVERNGGTIRVESTIGRGTTFIVSLPACKDQQAALPQRSQMV